MIGLTGLSPQYVLATQIKLLPLEQRTAERAGLRFQGDW